MANYRALTATAQVKVGAGKLKGIFVSGASATPTITVYDSAAATTTKTVLAVFTPAAATSYFFPLDGIYCGNGIYVVISGTVTAMQRGLPLVSVSYTRHCDDSPRNSSSLFTPPRRRG